jgi:hypothetical protein
MKKRIPLISAFLWTHSPIILGVSDTGETEEDAGFPSAIPRYTWVSSAIPSRLPTGRRPSLGVGAWVRNDLLPNLTVLNKESTMSTLWLRISLPEKKCHISISYNPPSENDAYPQLLRKLSETTKSLPHPIETLHMGDFNSRVPSITGDHSNNPNGKTLLSHISDNNLQIMTSCLSPPAYTYDCHSGKSIIDLFLKNQLNTSYSHYKCHPAVSFGSWHRLTSVQADWATNLSRTEANPWGSRCDIKFEISNNDIPHFQSSLDLDLAKIAPSLEDISLSTPTTRSTHLTIDQAYTNISTAILNSAKAAFETPAKDKQPLSRKTRIPGPIKKISDRINEIEKYENNLRYPRLNELMASLNDSHDTDFKKKNKEKWRNLEDAALSGDQNAFWALLKPNKHKKKINFPDYILTQVSEGIDRPIRDRKAIFDRIFHHMNDIGEYKDKPAKEFLKTNNLPPNSITKKREALRHESIKHFKRKAPETPAPITESELSDVIKTFKTKKTPGPDSIPNELLKLHTPLLLTSLTKLLNAFLHHQYVPPQLLKATLRLAHKTGNTHYLSNYRPLVMMNTILKLYEKVIDNRIRNSSLHLINQLQGGSQKGLGCVDTLFILQELFHQHNGQKILCSFDLSKAFDRVNRDLLWKKMSEMGIDEYLIRAVHSTYTNAHTSINIGARNSKQYSFNNGIKQGSVLSPVLFLIYVNEIIPTLTNEDNLSIRVQDHTIKIPALMFVDDLLIVASNTHALNRQVTALETYLLENLTISNPNKTTAIAHTIDDNTREWSTSSGIKLRDTSVMTYLGVLAHGKNNHTEHIKNLIHKANFKAYSLRSNGLKWGYIHPCTCITIIDKLIVSKLTQNLEILHLPHPLFKLLDRGIAKHVRTALCLPKSTPTAWTLWEAGLPDSKSLATTAVLRYWWKLSTSESDNLQNRIARDPSSLLSKKATGLILEANPTAPDCLMDPDHPNFPSKKGWKRLTKSWVNESRINSLRSDPRFAAGSQHLPVLTIKPQAWCDNTILSIKPPSLLRLILRARAQSLSLPCDAQAGHTASCALCLPNLLPCTLPHLVFDCPQFTHERSEFMGALQSLISPPTLESLGVLDKYAVIAKLLNGDCLGENSLQILKITALFIEDIRSNYPRVDLD